MIIGIDTNVMVARVIPGHPSHDKVQKRIDSFLADECRFALTATILSEFIHIVTDPKRFEKPLTMGEASEWARRWSDAEEVMLVTAEAAALRQWLRWMGAYGLGRKRLIDTLIAATWHTAGVQEIFTLNPDDFRIFGVFAIFGIEGE